MRGHVRRRGGGWVYVVDKGRDPTTGKRRQKWSAQFTTRAEAEAALAGDVVKLTRGERIDPDKTPLADYVTEWIAARHELAPLSVVQYTSVQRNHITPSVLGRTPLGKIRRADVRAFDRGLVDKGLSLSSRRVIRAVLSRALADALADDLIDSNPCQGAFARSDGTARDRTKYTFWTTSELREILGAAEGTRLAPLWRVLATCGLRRGEVLGIRWLDLDLDGRCVSVAQQVVPTRGGITIAPLKTKGSHRNLTLDSDTLAAIVEHKDRQRLERVLAGDAYEDHDLMFADELGRPIDPQRVTAWFRTLRKKAGVRPGRLHDLRHSHASHLLTSGVPVSAVAARLGHSSPVVTLTVYSHVIPSSDRQAVEAFAQELRD